MEKIDPGYLYELGSTIRSLRGMVIDEKQPWIAWSTASTVKDAVSTFIEFSIYSPGLRTSRAYGQRLITELDRFIARIADLEHEDAVKPEKWDSLNVMRAYNAFEPVMIAELQSLPVFLVPPRGAFDNAYLIDAGESLFPEILQIKVAESIPDVKEAGRCIAFNLATAAGFHLHRANEAVLRKYFLAVAGAENQPSVMTMGTLLGQLKKLKLGEQNVIAALDAIKEFHRNPLMHPDHSLQNIDEAIGLYCAIRAAMGYMLDSIPDPRIVDENLTILAGEASSGSQ